ncbi:MAG: 3'-5' exonuclease [Ruthenibacterium lactatiformans]
MISTVMMKADVVVLMTHAKGLSLIVFIVGLEEGIFPSEMSRYSNEDLEEERRLCYVGITRAKKELYLSCANSRMLFGQTKHNRPSRFLEEIDASLVEVEQSPAAAQTKAMRQRYMQQQNAYLQPEYGAASTLHGTGGIFGPLRRRFHALSGRRFTPCPAARLWEAVFHGSGGSTAPFRERRAAELSSGRPGGA